jgi:predicted RND superfamily exporter protein
MSTSERIIDWIWRRRRLCALACLAITLAAGWQATRVGIDNSLEIWFVDDDPALVSYRRFQERYGSDEAVVVAIHDRDGIVTERGIALLARAKAVLVRVEGVASVDSVVEEAVAAGDAGNARRRVLSDPLLVDRLVSRDGTTAMLIVRMHALENMDRERDQILGRIDRALASLRTPYHKAGFGVLYAALNELSMVDGFGLFCAASVGIFALLWLLYRRFVPALLTMAVSGAATVLTMGIYGAAGRSLNMVTSVMPTLVLVVTTAGCVHILQHVAGTTGGTSRRARVVRGVGFMVRPCLINTLTTAAALLSLAMSPLAVVRDLGLFAAAGLLGAFVLTLIGCVWALAWERAEPAAVEASPLRRVAERLVGYAVHNSRKVILCGAVVLVLLGAATARVVVDTYTLDFLFDDHPVRRDSDFIESHAAPYVPLEFEIRAPGGVLHPEVLDAIEHWQRAAEKLPGVGWSRSIVDVVERAYRIAAVEKTAALPQTQDELDALFEELRTATHGADLSALVDHPGGLRVTFGIPMQSARGVERTMRSIASAADLPAGVDLTPTGYLPLYLHMADYVVPSQLASFALAFLTVFAAIGFLFRSGWFAALAVPANLVPVVFILGAMGLAGIRLDVATVTIASVVLGLVVDDSVHFLYRLYHECRRRVVQAEALRATARAAGHSILTTTAALVVGFSVFGLAEIKSIIWFGLLIAIGLVAGVIADLVLMPALLVELEPRLRIAPIETRDSADDVATLGRVATDEEASHAR